MNETASSSELNMNELGNVLLHNQVVVIAKKTAMRSFFNTILKKYVVHAIYLSFTTLRLKVVYRCGYYIIRSVRYYTQKE